MDYEISKLFGFYIGDEKAFTIISAINNDSKFLKFNVFL